MPCFRKLTVRYSLQVVLRLQKSPGTAESYCGFALIS